MNKLEYVSRRNSLRGVGLPVMSLQAGSSRVSKHARGGPLEPDLAIIELTARPQSLALRPGSATAGRSHQAKVLKGDPVSVLTHPDSTLGLTLRVRFADFTGTYAIYQCRMRNCKIRASRLPA